MTSTEIAPASIEHLDLRPVCSSKDHGANPPRADYWVDFHGCEDHFACTPCLNFQRAWFDMPPVGAECGICGQYFTTFEAAHTKVRPL